MIVSLFDIHVESPDLSNTNSQPPLEILEAGTGHGALTLHLSRAIHGANPRKPAHTADTEPVTPSDDIVESSTPNATRETKLQQWRQDRRAILHTIDVSPKYSKHAAKVVRGFRHGMYADNVDFHVDDVSDWIRNELSTRAMAADSDTEQPFLTHAFLDLPSTHDHLDTVASAMHVDGMLMVFSPSITQIADCVSRVKLHGLPLHLDQVIELGNNGSGNGREWDIRAVVPRARLQSQQAESLHSADVPSSSTENVEAMNDHQENRIDPAKTGREWNMVCRPKVGEKIIGGGFLGVFKKIRDNTTPPAVESAPQSPP